MGQEYTIVNFRKRMWSRSLTWREVELKVYEAIGGLVVEVLRLKRWPVSGGDERERERRSSTCSTGLGVSTEKTGGTGLCVGVVGGVESPEPARHISTEDNEVLNLKLI